MVLPDCFFARGDFAVLLRVKIRKTATACVLPESSFRKTAETARLFDSDPRFPGFRSRRICNQYVGFWSVSCTINAMVAFFASEVASAEACDAAVRNLSVDKGKKMAQLPDALQRNQSNWPSWALALAPCVTVPGKLGCILDPLSPKHQKESCLSYGSTGKESQHEPQLKIQT